MSFRCQRWGYFFCLGKCEFSSNFRTQYWFLLLLLLLCWRFYYTDFVLQGLNAECKDQNLTTPHWLFFSTPQWTSTRHLSSNPTSFDSHASGCYPWWGDSNTFRHSQCWSPAAMWLLWVWLWVSHVQPRCPNTRSPTAGLPLSSWGCWRMMTSLFFCGVVSFTSTSSLYRLPTAMCMHHAKTVLYAYCTFLKLLKWCIWGIGLLKEF